jgi:hypothetical protein
MNKIGGSIVGWAAKGASALAVGAVLFLASAPAAHASPIMTMCITDLAPGSNGGCNLADSILLSSDGTTITSQVVGSAAILNDSTAADLLSGIFSVGVWNVNVDTGTVNPSAGNVLDLGFVDHTAPGTVGFHSLWIQFNYDTYTTGYQFSGSGGGTNEGTTDTFTGCYETSPGLGGFCPDAGLIGSVVFNQQGGFGGGFPNGGGNPPFNPFGLGILLQIDGTGVVSTSGDLSLVPSPEPVTMFLVGGGLLGLGLINKKRKKA